MMALNKNCQSIINSQKNTTFLNLLGIQSDEYYIYGGAVRDAALNAFHQISYNPNDLNKDIDYIFINENISDLNAKLVILEQQGKIKNKSPDRKAFHPLGEHGVRIFFPIKRGKDIKFIHADVECLPKGKTIEEHLMTKSFTVEAMAIDPVFGDIIDPMNGLGDVQQQKVIFSSNIENQIKDVPSLAFRYAKTVLRFPDADISQAADVSAAIQKNRADIMKTWDFHGFFANIKKVINDPKALKFLLDHNILASFFPEEDLNFNHYEQVLRHEEKLALRTPQTTARFLSLMWPKRPEQGKSRSYSNIHAYIHQMDQWHKRTEKREDVFKNRSEEFSMCRDIFDAVHVLNTSTGGFTTLEQYDNKWDEMNPDYKLCAVLLSDAVYNASKNEKKRHRNDLYLNAVDIVFAWKNARTVENKNNRKNLVSPL